MDDHGYHAPSMQGLWEGFCLNLSMYETQMVEANQTCWPACLGHCLSGGFLAQTVLPPRDMLQRNPAQGLFAADLHTHGMLARIVRGIARTHTANLADTPITTAD